MLKILQNKILTLLQRQPTPHIAAFDADGTLWSTDMGDEFLKAFAQTAGHEHVFQHYLTMRWGGQKREALIYACQVVAGMSPDAVDAFCEELFQRHLKSSVFPLMQEFLAWLLSKNVQVYIVTASPSWAVVPGAHFLGLEAENVLGLKTSLRNGFYTDELCTPYTSGEGKATALKQACLASHPFLTAGNTPDDLALLRLSRGLKVAVRSAPEGTRLGPIEKQLADQAVGEDWIKIDLRT